MSSIPHRLPVRCRRIRFVLRPRPSFHGFFPRLALSGLLAACAPGFPAVFIPPAPLDGLAREAAEGLASDPLALGLEAANGLERLGVRFEEDAWVAAARRRAAARLADPHPLAPEEAAALRERWAEIDLDPRVRDRLAAEGHRPQAPLPLADAAAASRALRALAAAVESGDPQRLVAAWGRIHARFGHVWVDGPRAAVAFDGMDLVREEGGWRARDRLGAGRDFTLRRAGGHASLRHIRAGGECFLQDSLPGENAPR